jgi:putative photosynthetic complex assembly protein
VVTDSLEDRRFPRGALLAVAALLAVTLVLAGASRLGIVGSQPLTVGTPVETRELRFADRADGGIDVTEASTNQLVFVVAAGTNGFLRSVLRGFARERKSKAVGIEPPFRLTRWDNGRLSLEDPSTGRRSDDLAAFGQTNAAAFAQLLDVRGAAQ